MDTFGGKGGGMWMYCHWYVACSILVLALTSLYVCAACVRVYAAKRKWLSVCSTLKLPGSCIEGSSTALEATWEWTCLFCNHTYSLDVDIAEGSYVRHLHAVYRFCYLLGFLVVFVLVFHVSCSCSSSSFPAFFSMFFSSCSSFPSFLLLVLRSPAWTMGDQRIGEVFSRVTVARLATCRLQGYAAVEWFVIVLIVHTAYFLSRLTWRAGTLQFHDERIILWHYQSITDKQSLK